MENYKEKVQLLKNNSYWVEIIIFLVMWVIAVFNYSNADYESYRLIYDYYIPNGTGLSVMPDPLLIPSLKNPCARESLICKKKSAKAALCLQTIPRWLPN